jgi:hypothetical protein
MWHMTEGESESESFAKPQKAPYCFPGIVSHKALRIRSPYRIIVRNSTKHLLLIITDFGSLLDIISETVLRNRSRYRIIQLYY